MHFMQARQERQTIQFGQHKGKTCAEVWAKDRSYAEWVLDQPGSNCVNFTAFQGWILRAKARIAYESSNPEEARAATAIVQERLESNREIARDDRLYCTYKLEDIANASLARIKMHLSKEKPPRQIQRKLALKPPKLKELTEQKQKPQHKLLECELAKKKKSLEY